MNRHFVLALTVGLFVGCFGPITPPTSFHLEVNPGSANDSDVQQTTLAFHPPEHTEITVETEGKMSMMRFDASKANGSKATIVKLIASRRENPVDGKVDFEVLIRLEAPNGDSAGGPSTFVLDADTLLSDVMSVTIVPGDYDLNTPIELGKLNGNSIFLTVREVEETRHRKPRTLFGWKTP